MKKAASAGDLVQQLLQQHGLEGKLREYRAWQVWDDVVGPQIALRARPVRVREGVLEVRVDQPVWMQQLQLLKPKILARLNERLGEAVLKDIFLRRGRVESSPTTPRESGPPPWKNATLSEQEQAEIDATLASLADPELKRHLRKILIRQKQVEKTRASD